MTKKTVSRVITPHRHVCSLRDGQALSKRSLMAFSWSELGLTEGCLYATYKRLVKLQSFLLVNIQDNAW